MVPESQKHHSSTRSHLLFAQKRNVFFSAANCSILQAYRKQNYVEYPDTYSTQMQKSFAWQRNINHFPFQSPQILSSKGYQNAIITHEGYIAASEGIVFSCICLSVCPRSERKTAWAINTKLCTRILFSSRLEYIDPDVKRSRSHGYENRHSHTVASDACCYSRVLLLLAWVRTSIQLPMFSSSVILFVIINLLKIK